MKKKKTSSLYLLIGSMLFGLFFGAGNLIFPVFVGQEAGANLIPATIGFIIAAAGIPFLGILAFGISKTRTVHELASFVNKKYANFLTIALYLTIGPFFALPRTATVSFEVGFASYIKEDNISLALAIFSIVFFSVALFFAMRSSKILTYIGKILNPIFLIFFSVLAITAIIKPMGDVSSQVVSDAYKISPIFKGFTDGYQTMDALAALAFGSVVIKTINDRDIHDTKEVSKITASSGAVSLFLMVLIYASLAWLGATSGNVLPKAKNGGIALAQISKYYFGNFGSIFLAITVTVACLKTAIGLITACSETFASILPFKISYTK